MEIEKARELLKENQFKEAEELLKNIEKISGNSPELLYLISYSLFNQGKYEEAIKKLQIIFHIKEDYPSAHHLEGYCYLLLNRHDMAEKSLLKALKLDGTPHINYLLGKVYHEKKERKKSIEHFHIALNNGIIYEDIYRDLCELHFEEEEFNESLKNLDLLLKSNKNDPYGNYMTGRCLFNQGNYKKAIKQLNRALLCNLEDSWRIKTIYLLALSYCGTGKFNSAEKIIRKNITSYPDYYDYYELLGKILISRMDYKRAREVFKRAIKLNNISAKDPLFHIAFTYIIENKFKKSIDKFKEIVSLWPEDIKSHYSLGIIYFNTGKTQEAVKHFEKCIEISKEENLSIKAGEYIKKLKLISYKF